MKNILFYILTFVTWNCNAKASLHEKIVIGEDENIQITLQYLLEADLSKSDWLKIEIKNKTNNDIIIESASYSINKEKTTKNGEKYIDKGEFGQSNKHRLIHEYYGIKNYLHRRDKVTIEPMKTITSWKYLTNYASVLLDGRELDDKVITALFELNFEYQIQDNNFEIYCENIPFSFSWTNSSSISPSLLVKRLKEIINNPHMVSVNTYVTDDLMKIDKVRESISTKEFIQGVLLREDLINTEENILFLSELKKRNEIPNSEITESFIRRFNQNKTTAKRELQHYWDDKLLDLLLNEDDSYLLYSIFELNANHWSSKQDNSDKIYKNIIKRLNFTFPTKINKENLDQWSKDIKLLAIARNLKFAQYLNEFLDDQTTFEIEDWSKFRHYGMLPQGAKPDTIKIRVCDVALVSLLRNMNQIQFSLSNSIGTKTYSMQIKDEILDENTIQKFNQFNSLKHIYMGLYERDIKLTSLIKERIAAGNDR